MTAWHDHAALAIARSLGRQCPHPRSYRVPITAQVKRGSGGPWHQETGVACKACGHLVSLENGRLDGPGGVYWVDRMEWTRD